MRTVAAYCNSVLLLGLIQPACAQTTTLQQYLSLTPQQVTAIKSLTSAFSSFVRDKQARASVVNQELQTIYSTPPPDPGQLGPRYLELEAIRRQEVDSLATLQRQAKAQLTPSQLIMIQALNAAAELQPLANDARCAFLLDQVPQTGTLLGLAPALGQVTLYLPSATLYNPFPGGIAYTSAITMPYIPPAPSATFCGSNTFPISVREYLNVTDAQVSTIAAASASYNDAYLRDQNQISGLQVQIRDQTAAPTPDPSAIGASYAQLSSLGQQIQTQAAQLRQTARATLTDAQSAQLKTIQNAATLQPLVSQAQACNLLVLTPGTQYPTTIYDPLTGSTFCPL